jgi:sortase A
MIRRRVGLRLRLVAAVLFAISGWPAGVAVAQSAPGSYPTIALDRSTAHPGDNIVVQFHNWQSRDVTLSICGNLARRGSVDCNIVGSEGVPISALSPETLSDFVVPVPPTTCPCVIRAANSTQTEIAYAPVVLIGVATGPLVSPSDFSPIDTTVDVRRVHAGLGAALRSALGGPTAYDVSVTLRNKSADTLTDVRPYGWAGRSKTDQSRTLSFPAVGDLGPGQSWTHVVHVRTPAPHLGRFYWEVSVSGAGPAVHAESVTRDTPWLLVVLVALIIGDIAVIVARRFRRRSSAPRATSTSDGEVASSPDVPLGSAAAK